jgi:fatty acid desaturase
MSSNSFPIPARLNLLLAALVVGGCVSLLWASGHVQSWWGMASIIVGYSLVMNTGYALCHEAEHDILHPNRGVNDAAGIILTLFFPASFHLRRQGHLGHHLRNRSDDEAFDLYFEGENRLWKHIQFYGILTGLFWLTIVFSNFIGAVHPRWLGRVTRLDRPTAALQETLNPGSFGWIRLECLLVFIFHGAMLYLFKIPLSHYLAVLGGFGFLWSTLQYIHHYDAVRDVQTGAWNVRTWRVFDWIWLHHHWHLNHHLHPTVSWIYLPRLNSKTGTPSIPFWTAYCRQWRGPHLTPVRVNNRHAGRLIK